MMEQNVAMKFAVMLAIAFALFLQSRILLTADVAYLIHVSEQLLAGGNYVSDFFESNPPMILYLYMPIIFLNKYCAMSIWSAAYLYLFSLAILSTIVCLNLLKKIFSKPNEVAYQYSLLAAVIFILFYLPAYQFGQREHLLMMTLLPYTFVQVLLCEHKPVSLYARIILSFLVAITVALKPFFLIPIIFTECYYMFNARSWFAFLRCEMIIICCVLCLYIMATFIFYPNYFTILLPLINTLYFFGLEQRWMIVLVNYVNSYCLVALVAYFILRKTKHQHNALANISLAMMLGMLLAYIIPRQSWYYHVMPAIAFAVLLVTQGFTYFVSSLTANHNSAQRLLWSDKLIVTLMAAIIYVLPVYVTGYCFYFLLIAKNETPRREVIQYIANLPGPKTLTCISIFSTTCFPLVYDSHVDQSAVGRFPFFWWLKGILKYQYTVPQKHTPPIIAQYKKFMLDEFAADLHVFKPRLIVINTEDIDYVVTHHFDYIKFLSTNDHFKQEWQHYHLLKTIAYYQIYQRERASLANAQDPG